jgi:putative ABC transport system permease protein
MRNKNLGIASEQRVVISLMDSPIQSRTEPFKNALQQHPNVLFTSASSTVPVRSKQQHLFRKEGADEKQRIWMNAYTVDPEFIETLGIDLVAGRNFSPRSLRETPPGTAEYIVNRAAAKILGWEDPIGKRIFRKNTLGTIIGVVEDFHIASLHHHIEPVVLYMEPGNKRYILAKIAPDNISGTLAFMREKWNEFDPSRPFVYSFLDAYFEQAYRNEEKLAQIFRAFSLQAIFIACLGLLGLAAYATERRTKEIGIRKVLGASVANVTALLSKDFVKLVLLANLIAWPVAWYAMNKWLQNFAYHIEISWWVFALAGSLALVIALVTVSTQAIRAALANPVESLRYE